jgi:phenylacetate-coenzyme A ligase PaaK-like adenylate-forming protein
MLDPIAPIDPFGPARRAFVERLPAHFQRLGWSPDQVVAHQTAALRDLLRCAIARSPFHSRRLTELVGDVDAFELAHLDRLPVMTKGEMLEHYDDLTTDRRLTRAAVETFLAQVGDEPEALFGEYVVLASGGSSGIRGVYAWHLDLVPDYLSAILRAGLSRAGGGEVPRGLSIALVAASSAIHATRVTAHVADGAVGRITHAPATLSIDELVRRLAAAQPVLLAGYAGALRRVADEQLAGRLAIKPAMVLSTSEYLTPDASATIAEAFGTPPANAFGSSEGLNGSALPGDRVFTFASDMAYVEFVDEHDRHVPTGSPAHHVLVTNLLNSTQPLIRYRLDDCMTQCPSLPGNGHQRATLEGRTDEVVRFGERQVHPIAVRTVLTHHAEVTEYQVHTTPSSMHVSVVCSGPLDVTRIADELACSLAAAGAEGIAVSVTSSEELRRDARTGKLPRFVTDST